MKKRNSLRWPALAGSLLGLVFAGNAWAAISISSATWQTSQRLYVLGSGAAGGATVTLKYSGDRTGHRHHDGEAVRDLDVPPGQRKPGALPRARRVRRLLRDAGRQRRPVQL